MIHGRGLVAVTAWLYGVWDRSLTFGWVNGGVLSLGMRLFVCFYLSAFIV